MRATPHLMKSNIKRFHGPLFPGKSPATVVRNISSTRFNPQSSNLSKLWIRPVELSLKIGLLASEETDPLSIFQYVAGKEVAK